MKTSYLRSFIEVVNLKSFSKAAEKLFLSQPAITKQIKSLEKDLGVVFLKRGYNDIIPTQEGQEFYKYASTIINKEDEIFQKFRKHDNDTSGTLTIYSSTLPANYLLDEILYSFSNQYNNISFNIKKSDSKKVYQDVNSGFINYGFTGMLLKYDNIECIEIAKDQLVLAIPANQYKLPEKPEVNLDFLLEQKLLIREVGSATLKTFEEELSKNQCSISELKIKAVIEDNEIIKRMIIKGLGVSVMSRLSIDKEVNEGTIVPLTIKDMELTRSVYFIYHKKRYFSKTEDKFKTFIREKYSV